MLLNSGTYAKKNTENNSLWSYFDHWNFNNGTRIDAYISGWRCLHSLHKKNKQKRLHNPFSLAASLVSILPSAPLYNWPFLKLLTELLRGEKINIGAIWETPMVSIPWMSDWQYGNSFMVTIWERHHIAHVWSCAYCSIMRMCAHMAAIGGNPIWWIARTRYRGHMGRGNPPPPYPFRWRFARADWCTCGFVLCDI